MSIVTGLTAARMLAIEAASVVSGAISGDNLILTKFDGSTINAGNVRGPMGLPGIGRNRIINGDFSVNQRAFTSSTVSNTFGHDRWNFNYTTGTCTYSNQNPTLGSLPESPKNSARIVTSGQSGATALALLLQKIEDVRTFSGKTVTVSFWAKAASGTPSIGIEFSQYFGSGGSPSATISTPAGKVQISTTWTRYSLTVTLPSISGKTLGSDNNDFIQLAIWVSAGSNYNTQTTTIGIQNNTFDIWGVQVEEGSVVTSFEQKSYAEELHVCQRYYEKRDCAMNTGNNLLAVVYNTPATVVAQWEYKVPKARVPNIIFPANGAARYVGSNQVTMDLTVSMSQVNAIACTLTVPGTYAGGAGWFDTFTVAANAEL